VPKVTTTSPLNISYSDPIASLLSSQTFTGFDGFPLPPSPQIIASPPLSRSYPISLSPAL